MIFQHFEFRVLSSHSPHMTGGAATSECTLPLVFQRNWTMDAVVGLGRVDRCVAWFGQDLISCKICIFYHGIKELWRIDYYYYKGVEIFVISSWGTRDGAQYLL